jgi:RNA polymerase sigma factor (sigma-70 family)
MTDETQLIEASRDGDPGAFRIIVERYQDAVLGVAMSRLHDLDDAEDVAQTTFVEAYQRLGSLKDNTKLGAWLRSIAHNCAVEMVRSRQRQRPLSRPEPRAHRSRICNKPRSGSACGRR